MLATPIAANRTSWRGMRGRHARRRSEPAGPRPSCGAQRRRAAARRSRAPGPTRQMPRRSARAVATMSTRQSGSSTQSTGTSWMRSPARSASTSSSVSKNQPVSSTSGSSRCGDVGADRLEAALRVGEAGRQRAAQQQVVAAGDELPLRPADHPGAAAEPGADRQVGVPGDQRGDQRQQRGEVGGEVHVACRPAPARRRPPRRARSARPRPFSASWTAVDAGQLAGQRRRRSRGGVGAGVVGDGDPEGVREVRGQVGVQAPDARLEVGLLVVDGDDDVEHDAAARRGAAQDPAQRAGRARDVDAHVVHARPRRCPALVVDLCASCASDPIGCSGHEAVPVRS